MADYTIEFRDRGGAVEARIGRARWGHALLSLCAAVASSGFVIALHQGGASTVTTALTAGLVGLFLYGAVVSVVNRFVVVVDEVSTKIGYGPLPWVFRKLRRIGRLRSIHGHYEQLGTDDEGRPVKVARLYFIDEDRRETSCEISFPLDRSAPEGLEELVDELSQRFGLLEVVTASSSIAATQRERC